MNMTMTDLKILWMPFKHIKVGQGFFLGNRDFGGFRIKSNSNLFFNPSNSLTSKLEGEQLNEKFELAPSGMKITLEVE